MFSSWHQWLLLFSLPSTAVNTILNRSSLANNHRFDRSRKRSSLKDLTWHSLCLGSFSLNFFFNFFFSSAQVPDNDEQFVPDYQAESCKYSMTHLLNFSVFLVSFSHSFSLVGFYFPCLFLHYVGTFLAYSHEVIIFVKLWHQQGPCMIWAELQSVAKENCFD